MSKSRAGKTPNANQNAPPAATQNAIVPGKFMESDWNDLLEIEDDECFISDLIDEITDAACDRVFENIIKSRVQPHTVLAARELLLDIIEWKFLRSDCGEQKIKDTSWIADDEPEECIIDNWAQGAVPVAKHYRLQTCAKVGCGFKCIEESSGESLSNRGSIGDISADGSITDDISFQDIENDEDMDNQKENIQSSTVATDDTFNPKDVNNNSEEPAGETNDVKQEKKSPVPPASNPHEKKSPVPPASKPLQKRTVTSKKYRPHVGSLPKFQTIPLESVTDLRPKPGTVLPKKSDTSMTPELLVRTQYGRTSGPTEVIYDEKGKVVKVQKLNVENFPNHRVPVKYSILDNAEETDKKLHFTSKSRYKSSKESVEKTILNNNAINAKNLMRKVHHISSRDQSSIPSSSNKFNELDMTPSPWELRSPLPPLMVDAMNLTDGVTIREGGLSKQVIKKTPQHILAGKRSIQPILSTANQVLDVKDIVSESSPSFRYTAPLEPLTGR